MNRDPNDGLQWRLFRVALVATLALLLAACGSSASPSPTGDYTFEDPKVEEAQARELAEAALAGWRDCDYARFSAAWDDAMLQGIPENAFKEFCAAYTEAHGSFTRIDSIEKTPANTAGHIRWVVRTTFENGPVTYNFVLRIDGDRIVGSFFDPAS